LAIHDGHSLHENTILGKTSFWSVQALVVTAATFGREIGLTVAGVKQHDERDEGNEHKFC
jgi:hypothetical protein